MLSIHTAFIYLLVFLWDSQEVNIVFLCTNNYLLNFMFPIGQKMPFNSGWRRGLSYQRTTSSLQRCVLWWMLYWTPKTSHSSFALWMGLMWWALSWCICNYIKLGTQVHKALLFDIWFETNQSSISINKVFLISNTRLNINLI
jgi:hypothetical protein